MSPVVFIRSDAGFATVAKAAVFHLALQCRALADRQWHDGRRSGAGSSSRARFSCSARCSVLLLYYSAGSHRRALLGSDGCT